MMNQARDSRVEELELDGKRWEVRFARMPRLLASAVLVTSCAVLLAWHFDVSLLPQVTFLKRSNAGAGFILAAIALWLQGRADGRLSDREVLLSRLASLFLTLLGGLTLLEYVLKLDFNIDLLLVREPEQSALFPGRMSPQEATCFFLLGLGSLSFGLPYWGRKVAMFLYAPVGAISFLGLVGYLQGATFLYQLNAHPPMSWICALGFLATVMGHFLCRSSSRPIPTLTSAGPAGMVTRRLVLAAIAAPVLLSCVNGFAVRRHIVSPELGLALFVCVLAWTLAWFAFQTARLLETSERRFKALFESMAVGMTEVDMRTRKFISANMKFRQIVGFSLEELRELSPQDITHPDDQSLERERFARLLRGEDPTYRVEKRYVRKDGATIWVRVDAAIVRRDENGKALTGVGAIVDITEEKEVALALERSELALRNAIQARDVFTSMASHELKTPLTNLLLRAQLAKRGVYASAPDESQDGIQDFLDHVEAQVLFLNKIVDEMLDVARIRSGKLTLNREWFDLNDSVSSVIGRLRPLLLAALGGKLPAVKCCEPVLGKWDRARIDQVLINLLSNVMRYGRGAPVEIRLEKRQGSVRLSVRDQGIGIAQDDIERIFGRFVAGSNSTSAKQGGLGLGLYLSRKIVEAHGGSIRADSQVGVGTTFIVDLPLEENGADTIEVA